MPLLLVLLIPAGATAAPATTQSANWAGYAIFGDNVRFERAAGAWTVPTVDCTPGRSQWSAVWVGLGGYSEDSPALEQIGTEADCDAAGHASYSSWYELVPDVSHGTGLATRPGDRMSASVLVHGAGVRLRLSNRTTGRSVVETLTARAIDVTSAEWIVEAPSACASAAGSSCRVMPLADFGSTRITEATAQTTAGRRGAISNPFWDAMRMHLAARFGTGASTSVLGGSGRSFTVVAR